MPDTDSQTPNADPPTDSGWSRSQILQDMWAKHVPAVGGNFGTMTPQEAATSRTPGTVLDEAVGEAVGLPQRVFEASENLRQGGDYDPAPAVEAVGMLTGLGAPFAEAGAAGIFGGKLAATADREALQRAVALDRQGQTRDVIFNETGWFRGKDGKWRFEIPDNKMMTEYGRGAAAQHVSHPELFEAYPQLKELGVDIQHSNSYGGSFNDAIGKLEAWGPTPHVVEMVTAHELQHAVQDIEGHAHGTNLQAAGGRDSYKRTAGEVEARNTERRLDLDAAERRELPPWETQDVPYDKQIFSTLNLGAEKSEDLLPGSEKMLGTVRKLQKPGRWPTYEAVNASGETRVFKDPKKAQYWSESPLVQRPDPPADPNELPPWINR